MWRQWMFNILIKIHSLVDDSNTINQCQSILCSPWLWQKWTSTIYVAGLRQLQTLINPKIPAILKTVSVPLDNHRNKGFIKIHKTIRRVWIEVHLNSVVSLFFILFALYYLFFIYILAPQFCLYNIFVCPFVSILSLFCYFFRHCLHEATPGFHKLHVYMKESYWHF